MSELNVKEIDLFELIQVLWSSKWQLLLTTLLTLLIGMSYNLLKGDTPPVYVSDIYINADIAPIEHPYFRHYQVNRSQVSSSEVSSSFESLFYSKTMFESWKKVAENSSISFEDFSKTTSVAGYTYSKPKSQQVAELVNIDGNLKVNIKSNDRKVIQNFFDYANMVNLFLTSKYLDKWQSKQVLIRDGIRAFEVDGKNFTESYEGNRALIFAVFLEGKIFELKNGRNLFTIEAPTLPRNTEPKMDTIVYILIYLALGLLLGIIFALVRNTIQKGQELANSK